MLNIPTHRFPFILLLFICLCRFDSTLFWFSLLFSAYLLSVSPYILSCSTVLLLINSLFYQILILLYNSYIIYFNRLNSSSPEFTLKYIPYSTAAFYPTLYTFVYYYIQFYFPLHLLLFVLFPPSLGLLLAILMSTFDDWMCVYMNRTLWAPWFWAGSRTRKTSYGRQWPAPDDGNVF